MWFLNKKKVKAWTQHKVKLHFLSTLSLNNTRTSFLTGSDSGGTTFFWARVFALLYLTLVGPYDGELTKSTIAAAASPSLSRFDGELAKSTMAALAFFLVGFPLLTALDDELGKSTIGIWMGSWVWTSGWFCSKFCEGGGRFCWIVGLDSTVATRPLTRWSSSSKRLTWRARASHLVLSAWSSSCHWLDGV